MTEENIIKTKDFVRYTEIAKILETKDDYHCRVNVINEREAGVGDCQASVYIRLGITGDNIEHIRGRYPEELIDSLLGKEEEVEETVTIDDIEYKVRDNYDGFYLYCLGYCNDKWFNDHGINAFDFVSDVVGYNPKNGVFPEVKTYGDLMEVVDAMKSYKPNKFKVGDKVRFVDCDDSINGHVSKHWARVKLTPGHTYTVEETYDNVIKVSGFDLAFDENQFILADEPIPYGTLININGIKYSSSERYLYRTRGVNSEVFIMLGIDKYKFLDDLGIYYESGCFPVVKRKDLPKVVDALIELSNKKCIKVGSIVKYQDSVFIVESVIGDIISLDNGVSVDESHIEVLRY